MIIKSYTVNCDRCGILMARYNYRPSLTVIRKYATVRINNGKPHIFCPNCITKINGLLYGPLPIINK